MPGHRLPDPLPVSPLADPRAAPTAYLLLPRTLEGFIQYDQAVDLLRSPAVHATRTYVSSRPRR